MNKKDPWERERKRLIKLIKKGKVKYDTNLYLVDSDGLTMLIRGDLIPVSGEVSELELKEI